MGRERGKWERATGQGLMRTQMFSATQKRRRSHLKSSPILEQNSVVATFKGFLMEDPVLHFMHYRPSLRGSPAFITVRVSLGSPTHTLGIALLL